MAIWSASSVALKTLSRPGEHRLGQRVGMGQRPQRRAQPTHAGGGPHALAHDVADHQDQPAVGEAERRRTSRRPRPPRPSRPEPGGQLEAGHLGQPVGQQAALQRHGGRPLPLVQPGPFQARSRTGRPARRGTASSRSATGSSRLEQQRADAAAGHGQVDLHPGPAVGDGDRPARRPGPGRRSGAAGGPRSGLGHHPAYVGDGQRLRQRRGGPLELLGALDAAAQRRVRPAAGR